MGTLGRDTGRRWGSARIAIALTAALALGGAVSAGAASAAPVTAKGKATTLRVCKHGCKFRTIQSAVNKVRNGKRTTIKIAPGKYKEGVRLIGHSYDGLKITGTGRHPDDVKLEGKGARVHIPGSGTQVAQNAIEAINVSGLQLLDMKAQNYATNGFFVHADPGKTCKGFLMKDLEAAFNRSYGLFAKHCIGGRITHSVGWGHGDSAFYIGETPPQKNPKPTEIDHVRAFENVLGYSGTNSKYVDIHDSYFFNNGAGIVPNTLDSELFEPAEQGQIHDNKIFWNNFNYYKPDSPVKTVSGGLGQIGDATINYPTGIGVVLFGASGWTITDNQIFGNFKWGVALFSDPFNEGGDALSQDNEITGNEIGRNATDPNGTDFWNDGSGSGNCFADNDAGAGTLTYGIAEGSDTTQDFLYPGCPAPPGSGTGTSFGDGDQLTTDLIPYVTADPPCAQQDSWVEHDHPDFEGLEPVEVGGACA